MSHSTHNHLDGVAPLPEVSKEMEYELKIVQAPHVLALHEIARYEGAVQDEIDSGKLVAPAD